MADRHQVDPATDIDRLLRAELAVEPSHEFLPGVRQRIRTEPPRTSWLSPWRIAPLAAAAALLVVAGLASWQSTRVAAPAGSTPLAATAYATNSPATRQAATSHAATSHAATQPPAPSPQHGAPSTQHPAPSTGHRAPGTQHPALSTQHPAPSTLHALSSEVLIDARQRAALMSFIEMARRGQISAEAFATTTPSPAVIADQVTTIVLADVTVSPIVPGGVLLFELERK